MPKIRQMPQFDVEIETREETFKHVASDAPDGLVQAVAQGGYCPPQWARETVVGYEVTVTARLHMSLEDAVRLSNEGKIAGYRGSFDGVTAKVQASMIGDTRSAAMSACADRFEGLGFADLAQYLREQFVL